MGWRHAVFALAFSLGCGGGSHVRQTFIALQDDFATFESWRRYDLGDMPIEGHPAGPRFAYLNQLPKKGAQEYPVGTIIVKAVELEEVVAWDVFAMVKRGGNFNAEGALNWEFF